MKESKIVLLGHDAFPAGSQLLLLNIAKHYVLKNIKTQICLLGDGVLYSQYKDICDTSIFKKEDDLKNFISLLKKEGFRYVLSNTVVTGNAVKLFKKAGFHVISLIHELHGFIQQKGFLYHYNNILYFSDVTIFPNQYVMETNNKFLNSNLSVINTKMLIKPQGLYKTMVYDETARLMVRKELKISEKDYIVINIGYGYHRKGLDIFVNVAHNLSTIHFLWIGNIENNFFKSHNLEVPSNVHLIPFTDNVSKYLSAADVFFLSSREDPFPSVVLEAISLGLPVISFDSGGGYVEILQDERLGRMVPFLNLEAMSQKISELLLNKQNLVDINYRKRFIQENYDFSSYCDFLLNLFVNDSLNDTMLQQIPHFPTISTIVPNYNYSQYLKKRLNSIVKQTYPIHELIILDDKSTDNSLAVIKEFIKDNSDLPKCSILENDKNSGSAYMQWYKGAVLTNGDYVWIAEADDSAEPDFLKSAIYIFESNSDLAFVFCDSSQIDEHDNTIGKSYWSYMNNAIYPSNLIPQISNENFVMSGPDFVKRYLCVKNIIINVSSVVWRRSCLLEVLKLTEQDHDNLKIACDWKMYVLAGLHKGKIGYISKSNNIHRRHSSSVIHASNNHRHLEEIMIVQKYISSQLELDKELLIKQQEYLRYLSKMWNI